MIQDNNSRFCRWQIAPTHFVKPLLLPFVILCGLLAAPAATFAQSYPSAPIHFIVPFGAGSSTDQLARIIGQSITEETKQAVVVETKPGGNGIIGVEAARNAKPDGYTVLIGSSATHTTNQFLYKAVNYDPEKDFTPVAPLTTGSFLFVVRPDSKIATIQEFIDAAKAQPGKITIGTGAPGNQLAGNMLAQMTHGQFLEILYKTVPAAINDVIGGQIDSTVASGAILTGLVKSGKLRALAVTSRARWAAFPNVPTVAESRVPGYEFTFWTGAWLPAKTPAPIVARLNELLTRALKSPAAQRQFEATSVDALTMSPNEFARFQAAEIARIGALIKAAGIQKE